MDNPCWTFRNYSYYRLGFCWTFVLGTEIDQATGHQKMGFDGATCLGDFRPLDMWDSGFWRIELISKEIVKEIVDLVDVESFTYLDLLLFPEAMTCTWSIARMRNCQ